MRAQGARVQTAKPAVDSISRGVNAGLPKLLLGKRPTSFFEFWPAWLIYTPVVIFWLLLAVRYRSLGLPMTVNPRIKLGGMVGESKSDILLQAGPELSKSILPFVTFNSVASETETLQAALEKARAKGLAFPLVVKPDLGCRGSGVKLLNSPDDLRAYIKGTAEGRCYLLQQLAPYVAEAGVFYVRHPGWKNGRIVSLTLKYRPTVMGDGHSNLRQLIVQHPRASKLVHLHCEQNADQLSRIAAEGEEVVLEFAGSHCRGSIFRNGQEYITPQMEVAFDTLLKELPEFYYGRLDVKFRDLNAFQRGSDFHIIEINGVSSEQTHIWDSRTGFIEALTTLCAQYKQLFEMGDALRAKGYRVPSVVTLIRTWLHELYP